MASNSEKDGSIGQTRGEIALSVAIRRGGFSPKDNGPRLLLDFRTLFDHGPTGGPIDADILYRIEARRKQVEA